VTLIERHAGVGEESSFSNAALIALSGLTLR
jgi:L-2-hydroxyglutarate oxidase LhgO